DILIEEVFHPCLHRSVATSVQDQSWLAAKQAGRIDSQRQVLANAGLCPMIENRLGVAGDPGGFHRGLALVAPPTLAPPAALGGGSLFRAGGNHWSRRRSRRGSRRRVGCKRRWLADR